MVTGFGMAVAGVSLGHHAHLTEWGVAIMAAAVAGAATRLGVAMKR
jgi:hypothetical protein